MMNVAKMLTLYTGIIHGVYCLMPHHFPNGKLIKFTPNNLVPKNDLVYLEPRKAALISTNWMTNIMHHTQSKELGRQFKSKNMINYENINVVADISQLINQEKIHDHALRNTSVFLLGWNPLGNHGRREILFIVYCKINKIDKRIIISQLIQSPFWCPDAIESINLKHSLEDLCNSIEGYEVYLDEMYLKNNKLKLNWETWNLNTDLLQDGEVSWGE